MLPFWNLRRTRAYRVVQSNFEPYNAVDDHLEEMSASYAPPAGASLHVSVSGFRAQAQGTSGCAALRAMREQHPVVVHALYTYLTVMGLLVALVLATFTHR